VSEQIPYADPLPAVLAHDEVERLLKVLTDLNMWTASALGPSDAVLVMR
jgi:hypothetical protein